MANDLVIFRTTNISGRIPRILRTVSHQTLNVTDLPYDNADLATLNSAERTLFFTRYGLSMFSDNAILYRGGRMAQLWKAALESAAEATRLAADFGAPIRDPMYHQSRIFFVSDKSGADNIWSMDQNGGDLRQHTERSQWQLRTPSLHEGTIVFQSGADIFAFDIATSTTREINLFLMSASDYKRERWI